MNEKADPNNTDRAQSARPVTSQAPNGLDLNPRPPRPVRVSRRAAGALMAIGAIILGLFAYGGYKRQQRQVAALAERDVPRNVSPATAAGVDIAKDIPSGNLPNAPVSGGKAADTGALVPPDQVQAGTTLRNGAEAGPPAQVFVRQAPMRTQAVSTPIMQAREPTPEERRLQAAYEREQQAIAAPTAMREGFGSQVFSGSPTAATVRSSGDDGAQLAAMVQNLARQNSGVHLDGPALRSLAARINPGPDGAGGGDQNMQDRKEAFLAKARAAQMEDYLKSTRTAPLSTYEIKAGWEIPAVLEQAMNSDLPGELKALVSSNVYDTASGRYLLIPQGARLIGGYNSRVGYGQDGVQVVWDRIIYPDGSSLDLSGMVGQDAHGASGLRDNVDRHYQRLIGFAVLTSMFAAASEIAQNQNRSLLTYPSPAQIAGSAAGQQAADLGAQITRRNLNVQPTIKIPVGYRFNVRVNRDILFDGPYEPDAPFTQTRRR